MKYQYSVECSTEKVKGETCIRRSILSVNGLTTSISPTINTIYDVFLNASKCFGSKNALGFRKVINYHIKEKEVTKMVNGRETRVLKDWTYYELSDYEYITFSELNQKAHAIGSGLRALGFSKNDRIAMYAATSYAWLTMEFSCITQSITIVAVYDTLKEGLIPSFIETEIKGIFCDAKLISNFIDSINSIVSLKVIVYFGELEEDVIKRINEEFKHIKVISFEDLESFGKNNMVDPVPPSPDDLLCIMYTSGTTNIPKGVLLLHRNVLSSVAAINSSFSSYMKNDFTVLCYLPLAHIYELVFELFCISLGITIGYGTVKTLSDANCWNCKGDIQTFKPSIMTGVPAVWENVRKGIVQKLEASSKIKRKAFWAAYNIKSRFLMRPVPGIGILDALVFKFIRAAMGGRLQVIFNGGAPISVETQKFLSTVICPMLIGYGLTETCAACTIMSPEQFCLGTVGSISSSVEIKLVDVPDAGYFTNSWPQRGEIWLRGPSLSSGYFNRDAENKESYTEDLWFKTGDIGEWTESGQLKIIDRKKNLVKTLNGEYIALEKLESVYRSCNIISNICVYADPNHVKPIAIVVPSEAPLKKFLLDKEIYLQDDDFSLLCQNNEVRYAILNELLSLAKKNNFATIEYLENIILTDEEFTVQNGLLTAAQKFQRRKIHVKYQREISIAYGSS